MALRSAPLGEPPPGFAADIAARAMQGNGDGIERSLVRGFTIVLAASLLAMPVLYGPQWWEAMQSVMTVGSLRLVLAGAACLGLSWILPRRALASRAGAMSR